jgi:prevent-host-death family protein
LTMVNDHGNLPPMRKKLPPQDSISVSEFKATCLSVLETVRRTGRPVLVTKRGQPLAEVVPPPAAGASWLGAMSGSAKLLDDAIEPAAAEWDVLGE